MNVVEALRTLTWFINVLDDILEAVLCGIITMETQIEYDILEAYFPGFDETGILNVNPNNRIAYDSIVNRMKQDLHAFYKLKDKLLDEYGFICKIVINPMTKKGYAVYDINSWHARRPVQTNDLIEALVHRDIPISYHRATKSKRHANEISMADVMIAYQTIKGDASQNDGSPKVDFDVDFVSIDAIFDSYDWNKFEIDDIDDDDDWWDPV